MGTNATGRSDPGALDRHRLRDEVLLEAFAAVGLPVAGELGPAEHCVVPPRPHHAVDPDGAGLRRRAASQAGTIWVNGMMGSWGYNAVFGGPKLTGNGQTNGREGLEQYLVTKTVSIKCAGV